MSPFTTAKTVKAIPIGKSSDFTFKKGQPATSKQMGRELESE